ncbi:GLPGLI family protein [Gillisia sp. Hel_I_86]|uniref:GLPGLI family protein n=1 Tax=Gillisia sp. Hel_I_86 TaxID=1249981 RepID=UPI00119C0C32|nr:GLPGLI family protein [Gillisia sp. Hel_I_86]TVZ27233.1 GLPGLI family protein [Gillisia sp. Hel_I_86]
MKTLIIYVLISIFSTQLFFSQNFQGIAVYKTKRQVQIKMDSSKVDNEMNKSIQEQLNRQFQKDYTLKFDGKESIYTENEKLEAPSTQANKGIQIKILGGNDIVYRNISDKTFVNQKEFMGKFFLIKDSLKSMDWKLESETKQIGNYVAYKATFTRDVKVKEFNSLDDEIIETTKQRTTTAWYTPEIPVSIGPAGYWGLPGLILEVQEDKQVFLCTEIILNPSEKFRIEVPSKGKVVSQEEFNAIQQEKKEEWIERNTGGRTKGGNKIISIKTSGK